VPSHVTEHCTVLCFASRAGVRDKWKGVTEAGLAQLLSIAVLLHSLTCSNIDVGNWLHFDRIPRPARLSRYMATPSTEALSTIPASPTTDSVSVPVTSNIASLRDTSSSVFSNQNFHNIGWAGVFGSFAPGTQTDLSDVDVVVIKKPRSETVRIPPLYLEDELPRVWGRKVDIVYITGNEFRGYISVEALLCSCTLIRSDKDDEVIQLRSNARSILDSGFAKFTAILNMIRKTQSIVSGNIIEACN
jgi:predicted nucleotidyltransferase